MASTRQTSNLRRSQPAELYLLGIPSRNLSLCHCLRFLFVLSSSTRVELMFLTKLVRTRRISKEKNASSIPTLLLTLRSLEQEWIHKILCLLYYSSLINNDSSLMDRACNFL
ncbi:Uncharacterized protein Rs2_14867 [Raphanus sativus]|nr:Uncharacterized protein Rs2_14867 [Raphanus sativus]